jgi:hypothetical protein
VGASAMILVAKHSGQARRRENRINPHLSPWPTKHRQASNPHRLPPTCNAPCGFPESQERRRIVGGQCHTPTTYSTPYYTKQNAVKRPNIADRGPNGADLRNTHAARRAAMSTDRCPNRADLRRQTNTENWPNIADRGPNEADQRKTHAETQAAMSTDRCPNGADLRGQTR